MSVKVHEGFCMDSFMDRLLWFDDFHGDQLQDEWNLAVVGGGAGAVIDAQTGGIYRLSATTNATADAAEINWADFRSLLVSKKITIEVRMKLSSVDDVLGQINLRFDGNDNIIIQYSDAVDNTWKIRCRAGGVGAPADSGIAPDTDYHIFRIECFPTDEVHFYIDGVETANSPITTNITALHLQPRIYCATEAVALKQLDVDYVYIRQER